jgi:hypothetical protein
MRGSIECRALVCGRCCFAGFRTANVHVRRVKQGTPSTHPIADAVQELLARMSVSRSLRGEVFMSETQLVTDVRVHIGARHPIHHRWLRAPDRSSRHQGQTCDQAAPAHAQARLQLRACKQGPRHEGAASLPWAPQHPTHLPTNGELGAERILVEVIFNEKDSHRSCRGSKHQRDGNCNVQQRERLVGLVVSWRSGRRRRNWRCRRQCTSPYGYYPYGPYADYGPRCGRVWNGYNWVPAL